MEKKVKYIHDTIHDELNIESPKLSVERDSLKVRKYLCVCALSVKQNTESWILVSSKV